MKAKVRLYPGLYILHVNMLSERVLTEASQSDFGSQGKNVILYSSVFTVVLFTAFCFVTSKLGLH